jgi:hypothetical protein
MHKIHTYVFSDKTGEQHTLASGRYMNITSKELMSSIVFEAQVSGDLVADLHCF